VYVMLCMMASLERFSSAEKLVKRWRSECRREFGIGVSEDLDRADWLPDLHQDTPLSQPSSLQS
jgi:hypothetical protein